MSKKTSCKMLVHQVSAVLPDDRPITAISVVEDLDKCPPNFTVVSRTYDQDTDADLWRESGLFIKKKGRYICFSKTEGQPDCVVEDIVVINERDTPPEGYSMISYTVDSRQKAWRKKQVCYKIRSKDLCAKAVTDIIICSRIIHKDSKLAPIGFSAAGIINGVRVCYKTVDITNANSDSRSYVNIEFYGSSSLLENPSPNPSNGTFHRPVPERPPKPKFSPKPPTNGIYPQIAANKDDELGDRDYEVLSPNARIRPTRPAPQPPMSTPSAVTSTPIYGTLPGSSDLDGVPFVLNPRLTTNHLDSANNKLPVIKVWTQKDLDREFFYDFRAERET
ncbi:PREDICTED: multivesicular body subunit 12B isoform X1 [Vollenhovia emeryi]|uniref:multivesicular body subunit 12B isoform X1 n=1 Tax=Vollenhovia emeryi TaxID=411798 RepID=UPI0005F3ED86|nr:PREDICTED: multivesicular body subunit 12B isoform X1 [Vollenhovia emeryi]XP_011883341.1 PREDICTED: multivesicular body subunit 12B isoform X1 [Vollenhovia emeryi]XP_011883343.1 PREDICTED: multivesicular body subunit 12B isoform X1 [Vollenhovia emeryi]